MNKHVLKEVSKMKVYVGPFIQSTTGAVVPFFNDSRCLYSYPKVMEIIAEELGRIVMEYKKKKRINVLVGIPMAGIPIAMAVSLKTKIPFAYLNKEQKKTLRKKWVEGDYKWGSNGVLIDDVIGLGSTALKAIKNCKKEGIKIRLVLVINDPWHLRNGSFKKRLKKMNVVFRNLYNRHEWSSYLYQRRKISKAALEIQKAYLTDPTGWNKNIEIWNKFLKWKKNYNKTGKL